MAKSVVINACFGGFSLSETAVRRLREVTGQPHWDSSVLPSEAWEDGTIETAPYFGHHYRGLRSDPMLVMVVKELGKAANGRCAQLEVREVEGKYRITEYDGLEAIEQPKDIEWEE